MLCLQSTASVDPLDWGMRCGRQSILHCYRNTGREAVLWTALQLFVVLVKYRRICCDINVRNEIFYILRVKRIKVLLGMEFIRFQFKIIRINAKIKVSLNSINAFTVNEWTERQTCVQTLYIYWNNFLEKISTLFYVRHNSSHLIVSRIKCIVLIHCFCVHRNRFYIRLIRVNSLLNITFVTFILRIASEVSN